MDAQSNDDWSRPSEAKTSNVSNKPGLTLENAGGELSGVKIWHRNWGFAGGFRMNDWYFARQAMANWTKSHSGSTNPQRNDGTELPVLFVKFLCRFSKMRRNGWYKVVPQFVREVGANRTNS
jgi:hypothetical protein